MLQWNGDVRVIIFNSQINYRLVHIIYLVFECYTYFLKGNLSATVKLLLCDLEITGLNLKNSLLQYKMKLRTIVPSLRSRIGESFRLPFMLCLTFVNVITDILIH